MTKSEFEAMLCDLLGEVAKNEQFAHVLVYENSIGAACTEAIQRLWLTEFPEDDRTRELRRQYKHLEDTGRFAFEVI